MAETLEEPTPTLPPPPGSHLIYLPLMFRSDTLAPPPPPDRIIVYTYDHLYRLTNASYSTGELYEYEYDPVGNRLQQIINGAPTNYFLSKINPKPQLLGVFNYQVLG